MNIHLLEPYRSAFIAQCLNESLIICNQPEVAFASMGIKLTNTTDFKEDVLQIATLAENLSMVFTNVSEENVKRNLPYFMDSGISKLGVINLINSYPNEDFIKKRWALVHDLRDLWQVESVELEIYRDLILSQLASRGKYINIFIFDFLKAFRLSDDSKVNFLLNSVPEELKHTIIYILNNPESVMEFDLPIFSTLQELQLIHFNAISSGFKLVGAFPSAQNEAHALKQIWAIIIDKLLEIDIQFPIPEKIIEVINLRNRPEIVDFRKFLEPFITSLKNGDKNSFSSLKKELRNCVKAFSRYPKTKKLSRWAGIVSIPLGIIETFTGLIGPSIGSALVGLGLEALATRWEKESKWIYLSKINTNK